VASVKPRAHAQIVLDDPRWLSIEARDASQDGSFVYSVKTTGVYCRPSCAARRPRPDNVAFHAAPADAERAGFRACKRCKPELGTAVERAAAQVAAMCRLIESSDSAPTLELLSRHVGLSTFYAHRLFKGHTGVTPHAYARARRGERVRRELREGGSVTQAIYGAGYGSSGRFYEQAEERLGMTPSQFKSGGDAAQIRFALAQCSLGAILVAATQRGVCCISLGDEPEPLLRELQQQFRGAELVGGDAAFESLVAQVIGLVERPGARSSLPLDIRGTAFQEQVWQALTRIPPGVTSTYAELASALGKPDAVRAVANACAANRLAVAIPCHRVVRTDGSLSGYRWGVERKRQLLEREVDT
jgi:AraC family transcriptional regulator, regulatory protein of adaptative response / methylated-DNA-[protein]-cysteine methyltransferase